MICSAHESVQQRQPLRVNNWIDISDGHPTGRAVKGGSAAMAATSASSLGTKRDGRSLAVVRSTGDCRPKQQHASGLRV